MNSTQIIQLESHTSKSREKKRISKSKQKSSISAKESMIHHPYNGYICFARREGTAELTAKHLNLHNAIERPKHRPTTSLFPTMIDHQPRIPAQVMSSLVQSRDVSRLAKDKHAVDALKRSRVPRPGIQEIMQIYRCQKNYLLGLSSLKRQVRLKAICSHIFNREMIEV